MDRIAYKMNIMLRIYKKDIWLPYLWTRDRPLRGKRKWTLITEFEEEAQHFV